jgi:hypothetical protein
MGVIVILLLVIIVLLGGGPFLLVTAAIVGLWLFAGLVGMIITFPIVWVQWRWQERRQRKVKT